MLIPNHRIDFLGVSHAGGSILAPAYVLPLLKATWGPRLASVESTPVPLNAPDRYREVSSIAEEETIWKQRYPQAFSIVYPNGLRAVVEEVLVKDAAERKAAALSAAAPTTPDPTLLAAGCDSKQALALQQAGYTDATKLPEDFLTLAVVPGITSDFALDLVAKGKAARAKPAEPAKKA